MRVAGVPKSSDTSQTPPGNFPKPDVVSRDDVDKPVPFYNKTFKIFVMTAYYMPLLLYSIRHMKDYGDGGDGIELVGALTWTTGGNCSGRGGVKPDPFVQA